MEESAIVIRTAREHFAELLCAGYILLGLVWLFSTERLLASVTHDPRLFERLNVLSWLVFIVVSAALAYALIIKARANEARLQEQLTKIAASSPSVICSFRMRPDSTFSFPYASPAIEEIYGIPPKALRHDASGIEAMVPARDVQRVKASLRASAATMSPWHEAWRVRHPAKGELWIEGSAMPVHDTDGSVLWHGVITDITARMTAEQTLRESETRYRTLFNAGRDAFFVFPIDEKGMPLNFTQVNDETCRMFGYTREELMNMSPADVLAPEAHAEMPELAAVLLRDGHFRREIDHVTKAGRPVVGDVTVTLFEIHGQRTGMAIVRDVSERRSAELTLRESTERLRLIARSVREVFFIVAPDFSKVYYVNEAFERLFGIPSERLATEPMAWMNAVHPGDHDAVREVIAGLARGVSAEIE